MRWGWAIFWLIIVSIAMGLIIPAIGVQNNGAAFLIGSVVGSATVLIVLYITNS